MGLGPPKTICLSGGFDPMHVGHVRKFEAVHNYSDPDCLYSEVIVLLNSDAWLMRKKGYVFMPYEERREILESCKWVREVFSVDDSDGTVCKALDILKPDYFGNGGDRTDSNTPEKALCEKLGIKMLWNLGGGKVQSSSALVNNGRKP